MMYVKHTRCCPWPDRQLRNGHVRALIERVGVAVTLCHVSK